MLKLGSHVGMSGKEMLLGSAKEAASYGANTFMFYTGAPQNTRRKEISELNIEPAWEYMKEHGIDEIVVHAPYIINLGNSVKPETFSLAVEFLAKEIDRTIACRSHTLILHPGAHVGAGVEIGTAQIIKGLNEVLTAETDCCIALETMAGKGSEIGRNFEELARIYDGVVQNDKLTPAIPVTADMISSIILMMLWSLLTVCLEKIRLPSSISMTAKIFQEPRKTGMKISALEKSVLMQFLQLSITRISNLYRRSLRLLIFLL